MFPWTTITVCEQASIYFYYNGFYSFYLTIGSTCELRTISNLFAVGKTTVCVILFEFCALVAQELEQHYLRRFYPPTQNMIEEMKRGFLNLWNFPQCYGCVGK